MSYDFCCNIHTVGSEFGLNNTMAWIHPALYEHYRSWWCCKCMGNIFLVHFRPLNSNCALVLRGLLLPTAVFLLTVSVPLWLEITHPLIAASSRILCHITKLKSSQIEHDTEFTVSKRPPHSQISIQQSNFGMRWNRRFTSGQQIVQLLCDVVMSIWTKIKSFLLNLCHKEFSQRWSKKGSIVVARCLVSVCLATSSATQMTHKWNLLKTCLKWRVWIQFLSSLETM